VLDHAPLDATLAALLWLVLEIGLFVVASMVFWKRPEDRAAGPFFALTIVAVGAYVGGYHWMQIVSQPILLVLFVLSAVLLPAVSLHFQNVFPRPKRWLTRWPRRALSVIYAPPLLMGVLILSGYFWVRWLVRADAPADEVRQVMSAIRLVIFASFALSACWFLGGVACLLHSYFHTDESSERNQVRWILFGSLLATGPIAYSLFLVLFRPLEFVGGGAGWPMFAASACITAAFIISITRYRLLRLDLLIGSGMVYFLASFLVGLLYYVLVFTAWLLVGSQIIPDPSLGQAFWVSSSALVMLVALDLIRGRISRTLEHHYRRDKHQLDRTLHQLSEAIEHLVEPPTLARHLLNTCADLLGVSRGAFYLGEGEPVIFRLAGALGAPPQLAELAPGCPLVDALQRQAVLSLQSRRDEAACQQLEGLGGEVALALGHENRLLGFLILGAKPSGFFGSDDLNLLAALAPIAALALQSASGRRAIQVLNHDLQEKVEKISEQQGRILALQRQLVLQKGAPGQTEVSSGAAPPVSEEREIVGSSVVVGELLDLVRKVAASPSAVLIRGESGTGKELLARAIHDHSARADRPFVKVHCAALSPTLLESELFGHVKGAFTGATSDKVGRFELANGGTLFLDEIGDISWDVQTKLLRVIQEKVFERVGSSEPVRVDVRIVAATHQNLERLIQQEKFREDLFYRLNVIPLTVPPLRDRREDIPELVHHFLKRHAAQTGRQVPDIDDDALAAILNYPWPGNIRELSNVLERAAVIADGPLISVHDLSDEVVRPGSRVGLPNGAADSPAGSRPRLPGQFIRKLDRAERQRLEREALVRALATAGGNKAEAARALGLARSTFLSKLQKHGLQ
jgi:transcriptional regulator with GAF, ATPase, and Fis domain